MDFITLSRNHSARVVLFVALAAALWGCGGEAGPGVDLSSAWRFSADSLGLGVTEGWYESEYSDTDWAVVDAGTCWDASGLGAYDGDGWYRRSFVAADGAPGGVLFFRSVDDRAEVWVNGRLVGTHDGANDPFTIGLGDAVRKGENIVAVRVSDDGGPGGICGDVRLVAPDQVNELYRTPYSGERARRSPEWVRDAIIYEVYLRSFSSEGTFEGLRKRVPELKDLGVTVLWLMPIHPVGVLNRKGGLGSPYSVVDYHGVNPEFGTADDFRRLVETIHENDMRVIIDLVANHTSWDSKWMKEHPEWFTRDNSGAIVAPNSDWTDVADLNFDNTELRGAMLAAMRYWVAHFDIDGYRCDVAEMVPLDFWEQARSQLERIKPVLMLSEGSIPEHHVEAFDITYAWNTYDILDELLAGAVPAGAIDNVLERERLAFPRGSLRLRFNTNHDKNAWDAPAPTKFTGAGMRLTSVLTFTLPGVPLLYNGQEVGSDVRLDLFEKIPIDWSDPQEYWPFYRNLARLRREHPVFAIGEYEALSVAGPPQVFAFARTSPAQTAVVLLNFGADTTSIDLTVPLSARPPGREYFSGERVDVNAGSLTARLEPRGFRVYVFQR